MPVAKNTKTDDAKDGKDYYDAVGKQPFESCVGDRTCVMTAEHRQFEALIHERQNFARPENQVNDDKTGISGFHRDSYVVDIGAKSV
jgi:hypothetical protein